MDNGNEIGIRDSILKFVTSLLYLARCDALSFASLLCFASFFWDEMKSSSLKNNSNNSLASLAWLLYYLLSPSCDLC